MMLTTTQITALTSELRNDPAGLGYSANVESGNDAANAALLNSLTGAGAGSVPSDPMARDQVLLNLAPALITLASLSDTLQAKWDRILSVLQSADTLAIGNTNVQGLFTAAVSDGVLTSEQAAAFPATRTGSRAEVLFGNGTVVTDEDVAGALGR